MPVRRSIQSSLTPSRAPMAAFETTFEGRLMPTDATAAPVRVRLAPRARIRELRSFVIVPKPHTIGQDSTYT
jgi:hypothetical protein